MHKRHRENLKSKQQLGWNLYSSNETTGKHYKTFNFIHFFFKTKVLVPFIIFFGWLIDKKVNLKIDNSPHNKLINILDKSWEESIICWQRDYMPFLSNSDEKFNSKKVRFKRFHKMMNHVSSTMLRNIKKIVLAGYLYDSVYREFGNIFTHIYTKKILTEYKDKYHLFYHNINAGDVRYLLIGHMLNKDEFNVYEVKKGEIKKVKRIKVSKIFK